MQGFKRRRYRGLGQVWADVRFLMKHRGDLRLVNSGDGLDGQFRERLMLAVTEVNRCRYCSFAHTRTALKEGVDRDEVRRLLRGELEGARDDELTGLMYAQHWAETEGQPDPEAVEGLVAAYGSEQAGLIEVALRAIRAGNYAGNTVDWLLHVLSFGLLGGDPAAVRSPSVDDGR